MISKYFCINLVSCLLMTHSYQVNKFFQQQRFFQRNLELGKLRKDMDKENLEINMSRKGLAKNGDRNTANMQQQSGSTKIRVTENANTTSLDIVEIHFQTASSSEPPKKKITGNLVKFLEHVLDFSSSSNKLPTYSSATEYGGHIIPELIPYTSIPSHENMYTNIVQLYTQQYQTRHSPSYTPPLDPSQDVTPTLVITDYAGHTKSAFLIYFPNHPGYQQFCHQITNTDLMFVSTVTFHGTMDYGDIALGLRIIYGFLKSMQLLDNYPTLTTWKKFYTHYQDYKDLTVIDAFDMINAQLTSHLTRNNSKNNSNNTKKIQYLLLIDDLGEIESRAVKAQMENPAHQVATAMSQLDGLLQQYKNAYMILTIANLNGATIEK